jgi:RNA polymerase sigma-70 factor (ECF subfamily)
MKEDPHVQLMLRFQNGDGSAFRQLFEAYKIPLLNFIYRYCQDKRVAEELSQEVFLRVYKTASSYRPDAKFSTWLYRIATNICLNEIRAGKNRYELELISRKAGDERKLFETVDQNSHTKTDDKIVEEERQQVVRDAVSSLPEKQRMALIFSVYEQLSYKEIGERLGCSEGAVKPIIHRAKMAIRDTLRRKLPR